MRVLGIKSPLLFFAIFLWFGLCLLKVRAEGEQEEGSATGEPEASGDAPEGEQAAEEGAETAEVEEAEAPVEDGGAEVESDASEGSEAAADEGVEAEEASGAADTPSGEGQEDCETVEGGSGSGEDIESILALADSKCKPKSAAASDGAEDSGSNALEDALATCDTTGMDSKLQECLSGIDERVSTMEQTVMAGKGMGDNNNDLEGQITLVLVKKGVIDCENSTQCDDDKACLSSLVQPGRMLCESPCDINRMRCYVRHSECVVSNHEGSCVCKEGFFGNGTENCVPEGFTAEANGKHYKMFDDKYVEWFDAKIQCEELGARLPVLDSQQTIDVITKYLETHNFTVFEQWDRSSRRVWLGLDYTGGMGLRWADGSWVQSYPASSQLFVWEARRLLSQEASRADSSRHYGFYVDGDLAKLPGGGRKGAAVLCELLPESMNQQQSTDPYYYYNGADGGYPNYPRNRYG